MVLEYIPFHFCNEKSYRSKILPFFTKYIWGSRTNVKHTSPASNISYGFPDYPLDYPLPTEEHRKYSVHNISYFASNIFIYSARRV